MKVSFYFDGIRHNDKLASMAQLDARPTGDQEVAGSTPTGSATLFRVDLIMKCFSLPAILKLRLSFLFAF